MESRGGIRTWAADDQALVSPIQGPIINNHGALGMYNVTACDVPAQATSIGSWRETSMRMGGRAAQDGKCLVRLRRDQVPNDSINPVEPNKTVEIGIAARALPDPVL